MSDDASLGEQVLRELPTLSPERRAELLGLPATRTSHARVLNEMPFLDVVEVDPGEPSLPAHIASLRVVTWNAERCKALSPSARLLAATRADVFLLSEMDLGMARSAQLHTTRELARSLGCGYVFAVEFLELDLGGRDERDRHAGQENRIGYHGGGASCRVGRCVDRRSSGSKRTGTGSTGSAASGGWAGASPCWPACAWLERT